MNIKSKSEIRKLMRERRRTYCVNDQGFIASRYSKEITSSLLFILKKILSSSLSRSDNVNLTLYKNIDGEVATYYILNELICMEGYSIYLPITIKDSRLMKFVNLNNLKDFNEFSVSNNSFSSGTQRVVIDPCEIDVVIVPLVAFDSKCYRLGMGFGYYDATLSYIKQIKMKSALFIGLAYSFQHAIHDLPRDEWDQPLDFIITESSIFFRKN